MGVHETPVQAAPEGCRALAAQEIKQRLFVHDLAPAADSDRSCPAAQRHFAGVGPNPWSFIGDGLEPRDKTAFIPIAA